jgi:hypothetical protein
VTAGPPTDDHDQLFKELLREFLPEFLDAFFPEWAARFDFAGTEWLDQEAFLDPPHGEKRVLDAVAKVPTREPVTDPAGGTADHQLVVVNVEVEWPDRAAGVRPRMWVHYDFLRRRHGLPVLPVCLFLRVGLDGIGWDAYEEQIWGHVLLRFEYAYVGLPALDGTKYATGPNLLALALSALMKLPAADRARLKAEGLERIARSRENDVRKYLLVECFDRYFRLTPPEQVEYERIQAERFVEVKTMVSTIEERGRLRGLRELVRKLLEKKFGPLPPEAVEKLATLGPEAIEAVALRYTDVSSLGELGLLDQPGGTASGPAGP